MRFAALAGLVLAAAIPVLGGPKRHGGQAGQEVHLPGEEFRKLDRFEGHALDKADKVFNAGNFRQAAAEYESFLREFPRSIALPYVLVRKARCLHLDDKRHEAIRQYDEVLDYFPNAVAYAAAALYYQGLAHWENGDEDKAMQHWARMAKDKEYRRHPLAAGAVNKLADHLAAGGNAEGAVGYFWQVAVDFRDDNPQAAEYARHKVVAHYVRMSPNEPKLRQFCAQARALRGARLGEEELARSFEYWSDLLDKVRKQGQFSEKEADLRGPYYAYWAARMDGKFPAEDDFQIAVAALHLAADKDVAAWIKRLDDQFARGKTDDCGRILKWIGTFAASKPKAMEYYGKLDFARMTHAQIITLAKALFDDLGEAKMARNALGKLSPAKMTDDEKARLARYLWERDFELGRDLCAAMQDKDRGRYELLLHYHAKRDVKNGLPLADHLAGVPEYANEALWKKGEILESNRQFADAILAYRQITDQPANLWRIATCHEKMGQIDKAVGQLREVEGFFEKHRAQAALRVGQVYKRAKLKDQCIAAFRQVLAKYPDTNESSAAHHELEEMGVTRITGGVGDGKED